MTSAVKPFAVLVTGPKLSEIAAALAIGVENGNREMSNAVDAIFLIMWRFVCIDFLREDKLKMGARSRCVALTQSRKTRTFYPQFSSVTLKEIFQNGDSRVRYTP